MLRTLFMCGIAFTAAAIGLAGEQSESPARSRHCLEERFADGVGPYNVVRFRSAEPTTIIPPEDLCLDSDVSTCKNLVRIDTGRRWFAGARAGDWVCISDGLVTGWTRAGQLELQPVPAVPPKQWLGSWKRQYGGARFRIAFAPDRKTLHVVGTAEWRGGPDATPNLGDLDADGVLVGNELRLGEPKCLDYDYNESHEECYDCVARLMMINGRIFAVDNHSCGGMNVNFDGMYDRVIQKKRP